MIYYLANSLSLLSRFIYLPMICFEILCLLACLLYLLYLLCFICCYVCFFNIYMLLFVFSVQINADDMNIYGVSRPTSSHWKVKEEL